MIDINLVREQKDWLKQKTKSKGYDVSLVDQAFDLDVQYRKSLTEVENLRSDRNKLKKDQIEEGKSIKLKLKELEPKLEQYEAELNSLLNQIPNPPLDNVPQGTNDTQNVEVKKWGDIPKFDFTPKDHLEIGKNLNNPVLI